MGCEAFTIKTARMIKVLILTGITGSVSIIGLAWTLSTIYVTNVGAIFGVVLSACTIIAIRISK